MASKSKKRASRPVSSIDEGRKSNRKTSPVYFLSLKVENLRCFGPEQTLDLTGKSGGPARWTVILGDNGTGKTTLLEALAFLQPTPEHFSSKEGEKLVFPRAFAEYPRTFDWGFARAHSVDSAQIVGKLALSARLDAKSGESIDSRFSIQDHARQTRSMNSNPLPEKYIGMACFGYGATRKMDESSLSSRVEDDPTGSLFNEAAQLTNPEEWLLQTDYGASKKSPVQKAAKARLEHVKQLLTAVLPDVNAIRLAAPDDPRDKPQVEFETPYGWVPIRRLGQGYRSMIAWTVDLARRLYEKYPESSDPLAEPAIVLVDEIDLHMHPRWQREIMSFLSERFTNTQFIVTAHSPLIVQAAGDANIAVLRREGDHVVIDQTFTGIRGWRVDQLLTSDLFGLESARAPEYDEVLAERKKLLTKSRLTKKDKEKLRTLEARMSELPSGESPGDIEAMDIIRRAASRIKDTGD